MKRRKRRSCLRFCRAHELKAERAKLIDGMTHAVVTSFSSREDAEECG